MLRLFRFMQVPLAVIALCLLAGFDWGPRKTLKELVREAPVIVLGRVIEVETQVGEYSGIKDFVYRHVTVDVQTGVKGVESARRLVLTVPGGRVGNVVAGGETAIPFAKGDDVLLFLRAADQGHYSVYSGSGVLPVVKRGEGTYFDTSRLKGNEATLAGAAALATRESVLSRIDDLLALRGD